MAENYKHLYEQMKKMVAMYQDEMVPGMRKQIEVLEKNQIGVRCKDCKRKESVLCPMSATYEDYPWHDTKDDDFCSYGERREGE